MTISTRPLRPPIPVARLCFNDGWLLLRPTFLNFGLPVVIVDRALVGDPGNYGLEHFGRRNPRALLPQARLQLETSGQTVALRDPLEQELIAWTVDEETSIRDGCTSAVILVGSTHSLQLSWSALWSMHVGLVCIKGRLSPSP